MQATTPSGDSLSISGNSAPALRRRGRPRVHADDSAKKAAYRQRIYERKVAALRRASARRLRRAPVERDLLSEAKTAYLEGDRELALALMEQHETQAEMAAYDQEVARSKRREDKPVKHNRACRENACLCDLTMSRGQFLTDAPRGVGLLVSGGYDIEQVELIYGIREAEEVCGGRRVAASGWGSHRNEDEHWSLRGDETEHALAERHFQDSSQFQCWVARCRRLPWAVDDQDRHVCELHKPVAE